MSTRSGTVHFDDVRAAARDHETYLSYEGIDIDDTAKDMSSPGFLPDVDNPRHDQLRRIVARTFMPRTVAKLEDDVRRVITGLVDRFAGTGTADLAQVSRTEFDGDHQARRARNDGSTEEVPR